MCVECVCIQFVSLFVRKLKIIRENERKREIEFTFCSFSTVRNGRSELEVISMERAEFFT